MRLRKSLVIHSFVICIHSYMTTQFSKKLLNYVCIAKCIVRMLRYSHIITQFLQASLPLVKKKIFEIHELFETLV
jgi:hypothetical protein